MEQRQRTHSIAADMAKGAAAGAAATWLMGRVTTWMYEREGESVRERENQARGDRTAYAAAVERLAGGVGVHVPADRREQWGRAFHWALGIMAGAAYAVARRRWPGAGALKGLPYGAGFFLVVDEIMNPVLGFTPGPLAFPWQAHARGLGGHLAYGAVSEMVLEGLDRVA
jgi:hypothetical protein